ncbi:hypothetical protein HPP92_028659 [Vanilla planifolia]|uniref:Uncharacterized protein n=1 Tax=Vanilla planifolia TaxID=51239 RepID=A0A835P5D4_VANPL|nr:hypothetical protein HPP92_028659 [Vanilla planifolia]KAG0446839.1 hypothetical protein HPP92_028652 [Vanilla planifolia]
MGQPLSGGDLQRTPSRRATSATYSGSGGERTGHRRGLGGDSDKFGHGRRSEERPGRLGMMRSF